MKKLLSTVLVAVLLFSMSFPSFAAESGMPFDVKAKSAVLMEASTGEILYEKLPDEPLPPASVTKIMTLLLTMEAIDGGKMSLSDTVSVSEYAASMGGSQVFLEPFEEMSAEDMLKSVVVASANDAAVALAEKVAGSEEAFVKRMNERAAELGMKNTSFENVTGLDDDTKNHVTSARDIAIMSRELIVNHPSILSYSSIWMDSIRGGEFGLTNTNRLVRFYKGATGLKTGSTSKAGFCISATATRDGMELIAVIMGSETRDIRNAAASALLDWGFANYEVYSDPGGNAGAVCVTGGEVSEIPTEYGPQSILLKKTGDSISKSIELAESVPAPVRKGDKVGSVTYTKDGVAVAQCEIKASQNAKRISYWDVILKIFCELV